MAALIKSSLTLLLCLLTGSALADLVVVTSPKSGIERLSRQEVVYLFMGRLRQLPNGAPAVPLDLAESQSERTDFYRQLVSKEPAEIKAYWSRLVFSGGSHPPLVVESREDLIRQIQGTPGAIGYIERSKLDGRLRIVFDFSQTN
jgi:hypothetical protein